MIEKKHGYELKKQKFELKHSSTEVTPSLEQKTAKEEKKQLTKRQPKKTHDKVKDETLNVVSPKQLDSGPAVTQAAGLAANPNPSSMGAIPATPRMAPRQAPSPEKTSSTTTQGQKKINVTKVQAPTKRLIPLELTYAAIQKFIQQANIKFTTVRQLTLKVQNAENRLERSLAEQDLKEERKLAKKETEQEKKALEHDNKLQKTAVTKPISRPEKPNPKVKTQAHNEEIVERPSQKK